jgi:hypothetical protein
MPRLGEALHSCCCKSELIEHKTKSHMYVYKEEVREGSACNVEQMRSRVLFRAVLSFGGRQLLQDKIQRGWK